MIKNIILIIFSFLQISCEISDKIVSKDAIILNSFNRNPEPLYVLDGLVVRSIDTLIPSLIAEIYVLKAQKAIDKYGYKGEHGVIEVVTKKEIYKR